MTRLITFGNSPTAEAPTVSAADVAAFGSIIEQCSQFTALPDLSKRAFSIKAFPNPTVGDLSILIEPAWSGRASVVLLDHLGRKVLAADSVPVQEGIMEFSLVSLAPGAYCFQVETGCGSARIMVQRTP